ncbi:hypothetical protein HY484_00740 [Candidatus Woesearchaeota archaeon]|nr:hypothetical protein [Candidatus Woesearchaeota archaeon]
MVQYEIVSFIVASAGKRLHAGAPTSPQLARSAPPYSDLLPPYREVAHEIISVGGKRVHVITKFYEPDVVVVEARSFVDSFWNNAALSFKRAIVDACVELAEKRYRFDDIYEEYTVFCVSGYKSLREFDKYHGRIACLMRNEIEPMEKFVVDAALSDSSLRYSSYDWVVVGWDAAVLFMDEAQEFPEVIEVLIVANIQLLKIRLLNKELESGLISIKQVLSTKRLIGWQLRDTLKQIIQLRTTSLFELEHAKTNINLLGDWYTATLFSLASKKFHLDNKTAEVEKRLDALEDVFEMVSSRVDSFYLIVLEALIVLLIIFEIVLAFL